jgi:hypothetical protein
MNTLLLTQYILSAAKKDRLILSFLIAIIVGVSLSAFLGSVAVTEKDQFFIVFAASILRTGAVITLFLFVTYFVRRSFELREIEFLLTKPISIFQMILAHLLAFSFLAFCFSLIAFFVLLLISNGVNLSGLLLWSFSLLSELIIISHVALFFSMILKSVITASLATISFYLLSRMIGGILAAIKTDAATGMSLVLEKIMLIISMVTPRLDLMGQGDWLIYKDVNTMFIWFIPLQMIVFCSLVFFATMSDLHKKQF